MCYVFMLSQREGEREGEKEAERERERETDRQTDLHHSFLLLHLHLGQCQAADMYVEQLRNHIQNSVPKGRLAAFCAEPIQVSKAISFESGV